VPSDNVNRIVAARAGDPGAIEAAAARRIKAASLTGGHGKALIIAADHPARGTARGPVGGRSLLHPADGDAAGAVDGAVSLP
jgi:hypothetical protein